MISRRHILTGVAAAAALGPAAALAADRRPVAYRRAGAPVRYSFQGDRFAIFRRIMAASTWRYQSLDVAGAPYCGVIRHLPTGFVFLTEPDSAAPKPFNDDKFLALMLFAEGEARGQQPALRSGLAAAAAFIATEVELFGGGSLHLPRNWFVTAVAEREAPPFIAARTAHGLLLAPV
ncbi:MAG: hypothetical protein KGQ37_08760 [Hyphomicrobiales bacterium]|nr:hypothetical protein [Hyphomicrobiales bacterium]